MLNQTPYKYSTPSSKTSTPNEPPTPTRSPKSARSQHYTVLKMISNDCMSPQRKGSLFSQRSLSNTSQDCVLEDRFIPSRRLLGEFDACDNRVSDQNGPNKDPQAMTVAEIFSEEILGKSTHKQENQNQNDIESFKNKNLLKFKLDNANTKPNCKIYNSINELSNHYVKGRKINKVPCKILDAPALTDDFYLNLVDWSADNLLAVGLGNSIYLWNADSSKVTRLCELPNDTITSVCWAGLGSSLAIGCNKGEVLIWDIAQQKQSRKFQGHELRVGSLAWSKKLLSTGSRDKTILQRDIRSSKNYIQKLAEHGQEICGLKWSKDDQYLASGGNDNKAIVWNLNGQPINKFTDHKAAVKAIAWSPHHHGLLATGGGTADRMLKMRNIFTGEILSSEDTGSQICNLEFSKSLHEVVSTHGYSQNEINIWSYPNMKKIASLKGHTQRVLYLATSPDGSTIVTGAGDETLRFWNIFPSIGSGNGCQSSLLEGGLTFR